MVVAVPDHIHYEIIKTALEYNQHICCVKPLVLKYSQAVEIEKEAYEKGLAVGVEYHKRMDDRVLIARRQYREGLFGEFRIGHAEMNEPYYYRHSNFQNWCTCENSDMFSYVGCHYVDQVHMITGLLPKIVSVYGIKDKYPNGREGYLWTDARVIWENGACLNVTDVMGYPDEGPGGNYQGLRMYFAGKDKSGLLVHDDQYRGIKYCYVKKGTREPNYELAWDVVYRCYLKGLLMFAPVGVGGGCVKIGPPLCITEEALNEGCDVIAEALKESKLL